MAECLRVVSVNIEVDSNKRTQVFAADFDSVYDAKVAVDEFFESLS